MEIGMNSKKGISLVALIITIIVIIILATISLIGTFNTVEQANWAKFTSDYSEVQETVKLKAAELYGEYIAKGASGGSGTNRRPSYAEIYQEVATGILPDKGTAQNRNKIITFGNQKYIPIQKPEYGGDWYIENNGEVYYSGFAYENKIWTTPDKVIADGNEGPVLDEGGYATENYTSLNNKVTIPKGFGIANLNDDGVVIGRKPKDEWEQYITSNIDKGIVIVDESGNEFVWVPVDSVPPDILSGGTGFDSKPKEFDPLVEFSEVTFKRVAWTETTQQALSDGNPSSGEPFWDRTNEMDGTKKEYNELVKSVNIYKGFYIGRYEAAYGGGIDASTYKPLSKKSTDKSLTAFSKNTSNIGMLWNNISNQDAIAACRNMYAGSETVKSHLIYGIEWDTTLKWILKTGERTLQEVTQNSKTWGNYTDSIDIEGNPFPGRGSLQISGYSKYWSVNNIFDLAGNQGEHTQEARKKWEEQATSGSVCYRAGGSNAIVGGSNQRSSSRVDLWSTSVAQTLGFRVAIYIK